MNKKVETILEAFIANEITSTEQRIAAIRAFVETLRNELLSYTSRIPETKEDREYFSVVLKLFRNMINTYDDEIKTLIAKRSRMLDHLMSVRTVSAYLQPTQYTSNINVN